MGTSTHRTLADRAGGIARMIRALGTDPTEWDPHDLHRITELEAELVILRARIIYSLREQGATDRDIGEVMGVTPQAVSKRWPGGGRYVGAAGRYRKTVARNGGVNARP